MIDHNRFEDLVVALESPTGTRVVIRDRQAHSSGRLELTGLSLDDFHGENPEGVWRLHVVDTAAGTTGETWFYKLQFSTPHHPTRYTYDDQNRIIAAHDATGARLFATTYHADGRVATQDDGVDTNEIQLDPEKLLEQELQRATEQFQRLVQRSNDRHKIATAALKSENESLKGKLAYMAPEQLSGEDIAPHTDVYAAAVVAWEALANERLFDGEDVRAGREDIVVVSHGLWESRWGGDDGLVGRTIQVGDRALEVVGVVADGVHLPGSRVDLWLPYVVPPGMRADDAFRLNVLARLNHLGHILRRRRIARTGRQNRPARQKDAYDGNREKTCHVSSSKRV